MFYLRSIDIFCFESHTELKNTSLNLPGEIRHFWYAPLEMNENEWDLRSYISTEKVENNS